MSDLLISFNDLNSVVGTAAAPRVLDVRRRAAYDADAATLPAATWRDHARVEEWAHEIAPGSSIVLACAHGAGVSQLAAATLRRLGVDARALQGGVEGWKKAGGTTLVAFIAYGIIAFIQGQEYVATFAFIIAGANLGFLWYNAHPALVFMGDTGALALGSSLAVVALMTGQWLLLPVIGIVFVIEALSNIIQIAYFRATGGKRFFKRAPFHMHLELSGWAETQIVTRAWLVAIAAAMLGVALALAVPE